MNDTPPLADVPGSPNRVNVTVNVHNNPPATPPPMAPSVLRPLGYAVIGLLVIGFIVGQMVVGGVITITIP